MLITRQETFKQKLIHFLKKKKKKLETMTMRWHKLKQEKSLQLLWRWTFRGMLFDYWSTQNPNEVWNKEEFREKETK